MLSNLASYIFGGNNTETVAEGQQSHEVKVAKQRPQHEEDWEIVGGDVQPSLTLGSLDEVAPRPSTGSTGSSETPSEVILELIRNFVEIIYICSILGWPRRSRRYGDSRSRIAFANQWSTRNCLNEVSPSANQPPFLSQWHVIASNESFKELAKGQAEECCKTVDP